MTLVILALAAAVLARLADRSLSLAQASRVRSLDLQEKWATLSCRLRLLEPAERVLGDYGAELEADGVGWPHPSQVEGQFMLGGAEWRFVLSDEQSKANLNVLYAERPALVPALLGESSQDSGALLPVKLRPEPVRNRSLSHRYFGNWGRVVDLGAAVSHPHAAEDLIRLADRLTCWGDGRLNFTRANDAALLAIAQLAVNPSEARRLVEARKGYAGEFDELIESVEIPRRKRAALRRRLTDRSSCHALWLVRGTRHGQRLTLVVHEPGSRVGPERQVYQWP